MDSKGYSRTLDINWAILSLGVLLAAAPARAQMSGSFEIGSSQEIPSQDAPTQTTGPGELFGQGPGSNPGLTTGGRIAIATVTGLVSGAASYVVWVLLHEGSHAVVAESVGANVLSFNFIPERRPDNVIIFASVQMDFPAGEVTSHESGMIDLAPNITGLALGTLGTIAWATDALPNDPVWRMIFATFQIGASLNGGINGVWSGKEGLDVTKAVATFNLSPQQATLLRASLTTGAVLNLVPAIDSIYHAYTGRSLFPSLNSRSGNSSVQVYPIASPQFMGVGVDF